MEFFSLSIPLITLNESTFSFLYLFPYPPKKPSAISFMKKIKPTISVLFIFSFSKKRELLCKYSAIWFQILFVVWWAIFLNTTPAFLPGLTNRFLKENFHVTFLHSSDVNFSHAYSEWNYHYSLSCKRKKKLFMYFILKKKPEITSKSFFYLKFHHFLSQEMACTI